MNIIKNEKEKDIEKNLISGKQSKKENIEINDINDNLINKQKVLYKQISFKSNLTSQTNPLIIDEEDQNTFLNKTVVVKKSNLLDNGNSREIIRQRVIEMRKKAKEDEDNIKKLNESDNKIDKNSDNNNLMKFNSNKISEFSEAIKEKLFGERSKNTSNENIEMENQENINHVEIPMKIISNQESKKKDCLLRKINTPEFKNRKENNKKEIINQNEFELNLDNICSNKLLSPKKLFIESNKIINDINCKNDTSVNFSFMENKSGFPNFDLNNISQSNNNFLKKNEDKNDNFNSSERLNNNNNILKNIEDILVKVDLLNTKLEDNTLTKERDKEFIINDIIYFIKKDPSYHIHNENEKESSSNEKFEKEQNKITNNPQNNLTSSSKIDENLFTKITQDNKKLINNFYDKLILMIEGKFNNLISQKLNSLEQKLNLHIVNNSNFKNTIKGLELCDDQNSNIGLNINQLIERNYQDIIDYMKINFKEIKQIYNHESNANLKNTSDDEKFSKNNNYNSDLNKYKNKCESEASIKKIVDNSFDIFKKDFIEYFEKVNNMTSVNSKQLEKILEIIEMQISNNESLINENKNFNFNNSCILKNNKEFNKENNQIENFINVNNQNALINNTNNALGIEKINQISELTENINNSLNNNFLNKVNILFEKTEINYDQKLKSIIGEMYVHKWCYSCEKINFNYSFLKCQTCKIDYCINCTFKCLKCDIIYCKYCVECSLCRDYFCNECRKTCNNTNCENKTNYLRYLLIEDKSIQNKDKNINLNKNYIYNNKLEDNEDFSLVSDKNTNKEFLDKDSINKKKIYKNKLENLQKIRGMIIRIRSTTENQISYKYKKEINEKQNYFTINKIPENNFLETCKDFKICDNCSNPCKKCKKNYCKEDCLAKCHVCVFDVCYNCSKNCYICKNSCCQICTEKYKFAICYCCKNSTCGSCLEFCQICDLEPCSNCIFKCEYCKRKGCQNDKKKCGECNKLFCHTCTNDFKFNYCSLCKEIHCDVCSETNLSKCSKCKMIVCLKCSNNCRKCKDIYCKNCKIRCQNCSDVICENCIFLCICEKIFFCQNCLFDVKPICSHDCIQFINGTSIFTGRKTRSKLSVPDSFEAKFFLECLDSNNVLIGLTDNCNWEDDSLTYTDDIWGFKPLTGEKYSSKKGVEKYLKIQGKEKDFILVTKIKQDLFFRVNYDLTPVAYKLENNKNLNEYYLYIENDKILSKSKIVFVYIRRI